MSGQSFYKHVKGALQYVYRVLQNTSEVVSDNEGLCSWERSKRAGEFGGEFNYAICFFFSFEIHIRVSARLVLRRT